MKMMKTISRNVQSLWKRSSVHFLILGGMFACVLCVYIVTTAKTKECLAAKLDEDYRARHQEGVDRTSAREYSVSLSSQKHLTYVDERTEQKSEADIDSSRDPYSSAAVAKVAGSKSYGDEQQEQRTGAALDEERGTDEVISSKLQQPKEMPLVEFCSSDEKKKRYLSDETNNVTASELPDSVVNSVQKFIFFVGYPRSGHSIIGSLLDSHPNIIISNEFGMFRKLIEEPDYQQATSSLLYNALYRSSVCSYYFGLRAEEATKKGYSLRVDDSWQASYDGTIFVIGEKSGGNTCMTYRNYGHDKFSETLEKLLSIVDVPVFTIHAVRNPYDNIATMALMSKKSTVSKLDLTPENPYKNDELLDWAIDNYFSRVETVNEILTTLELNIIEIHSNDLILQPKQTFSQICAVLEVPCDDQYLDTVADKVFPEISKTRALIVWTPEHKTRVAEEMKKYDFLHRYTFDN